MITGVPLASLPGVRGWLGGIHDDLRAGRSCLCLLPRVHTCDTDCTADALLAELLHEIGTFVLLSDSKPGSTAVRSHASPAQPARHWSSLAPLLDYDDGMSAFGTGSAPHANAANSLRATTLLCEPVRPITPAESLAELAGRLADQLLGDVLPTALPSRSDLAMLRSADDVFARLVGAAGGRLETRPLVIKAWKEQSPPVAADFLRRLAARAKEVGLPPAQRPRALVVAVADDLPMGLPDQLAREEIAVHWWWGAVGRLDTATVVAVNRPPTRGLGKRRQLLEQVVQSVITELSGPFLEIAAALAARWDGNTETLTDKLRCIIADTAVGDIAQPTAQDRSGETAFRPSESALSSWSAGRIDSWGGRTRHHPAYDLTERQSSTTTRVWLAQHHALLPRLDAAREEFADIVRRRTRIPLLQLAQRYGTDPIDTPTGPLIERDIDRILATMELGSMWKAHANGHIALNEAERRKLRVLRQSRNRLAHRTPLDGAQLRSLIAELSD